MPEEPQVAVMQEMGASALENLLDSNELRMATDEEVTQAGLVAGSASPISEMPTIPETSRWIVSPTSLWLNPGTYAKIAPHRWMPSGVSR